MRNMKNVVWKTLCLTAVLIMAGITTVQATPPDTISYQGFLTNTSGTPINTTVSIGVGLHTAATGGTAIFTETHGSVSVANGQFNIQLGSVGAGWTAIDFAQPLWVEISAGGETMSPRVPLSAVAYARYAFLVADGAITAAGLSGSPGNGTDGQFLASDGTGGFKWTDGATQPFRLPVFTSEPYACDTTVLGALAATISGSICTCTSTYSSPPYEWRSARGYGCDWNDDAD